MTLDEGVVLRGTCDPLFSHRCVLKDLGVAPRFGMCQWSSCDTELLSLSIISPSSSMPKKCFRLPFFTFAFFREAAKECRRRKKEYVKCLESRVAMLEVQNKKLIEELETLKDICSSKTD